MKRANLAALVIVVLVGAVTVAVALARVEPEQFNERGSPARPAAPSPEQRVAEPAPLPRSGLCFRLEYAEAIARSSSAPPADCAREHTTETFHVTRLDLVADGHLLAVDSESAQEQAASACRLAVAQHLDATTEALRLTMLEPIWFTPTVDQARAGADWLRCDVVAASGGERLVPLPEETAGLLADGGDAFAMCGTAEPGAAAFSRVVCSAPHSWRALVSVDLAGTSYPTAARAGRAMQPRCREAAAEASANPLDFSWAEERPTVGQWEAGRRYGLCWVPEEG